MVNTHPSLRQADNNCAFTTVEERYQMFPGSIFMDRRKYLVTTRDILPGEELFVWLGNDIAAHIEEERLTWPDYQAYCQALDAWRARQVE